MKPPWAGKPTLLIVPIALLCSIHVSSQVTPVRLVGGTSKYAGRLEVYHEGVWGTVCGRYASNNIADVVCAQLGYHSDVGHIRYNAYYGAGTGRIWMDYVRCTGTESSIDKCKFRGWGIHVNCGHSNDLSVICTGYVSRVSPKYGSLQGGTTITLEGVGFSSNSFNHFPGTEHLGNKVYFVNKYNVFPCDVIVQKSSTSKIVCVTASMPEGAYTFQVSVDGIDIPSICSYSSYCQFQPREYNSPTISGITPVSGPPGTVLILKGKIFTSKYGFNVSSTNGAVDHISRVMVGGDMCDLKSPDGQTYGIVVDNIGGSGNGFMSCKLSEFGSKIGNINASFSLSVQGRSKTNLNLYRVSRNWQIFMFQSYAEIDSISPSSGSTEGGTVITITGRFFDETRSNAVVKVGGTDCHVMHINDTTIICRTVLEPYTSRLLYPGNRGTIVESWAETLANRYDLEMIKTLNESSPDYHVMVTDTTHIPGGGISKTYVNRLKGFFLPPFDGEYQFVLTSTGSQFYLSTDADEANLKLLKSWEYTGAYTTTTMLLHSNQSYYMEVFYRQTTRSTAMKVAVRYFDSIVNHYMAGNVQQEEQEIELTSTVLKEQQTITIANISNQTTVYEEQEIVVETSDEHSEPGRFRLGMYSVYTESISVGVSDIGMMNALQALPVFDVSENVFVNRTAHGQGFKYTIMFISERGNFPVIEWKKLSGTFSVQINTIQDGKPSGGKVGLMMAGIPAPLVDSNASQAQISDALEELFLARCPTYLTAPKRKAVHYNIEESASLPSYMSGRTNQYPAFCGNWILRNPYRLHDSGYADTSDIYLTINPFFCMAFKGDISDVYMLFDYTDGNGRRISRTHNFYDLVEPMYTKEWNYGCYNLQNAITAIISDATNVVLRRLQIHRTGDVLVDEVYFGPQPTTSDTDEAYMRRLVCSPNGYKITDVKVTKYEDRYDVTLSTVTGGHGFPFFTVDDTQLPPEMNVTVVRRVAASPPISGTFDLTLGDQTLTAIPVGLGSSDMEAIIQEFKNIGVIKTTYNPSSMYNFHWRFRFDTYPGNLEQIQMNSSSVSGDNLNQYVRTLSDGRYMIDPLYGEMLQTAHDKPQVTVVINDVPSKCAGSCTFEWLPSSTPIINNASRVQEPPYKTIQIYGTGFSEIPSNNNVTIAGVVCIVTTASDTMITCDIDNVPSGEHAVVVDVRESGLATYGDGNVTIFFSMHIDSINPTRSGLGGSVNLSITGNGFSENSSVTVGAQTCDKLFVTTTSIICLVPPTNVAMTVTVVVDQIGELPVTADTQFTYDESMTPRVTSIAPTSNRVSGGDTLVIAGDGFEAQDNVTLVIDGIEINITFYNNSYVTAELPPCSPGSHHVKLVVGDDGAALTSENELPSIRCRLEVTNVNPLIGSLFGGTSLTLSGDGFAPGVKVNVGAQVCEVTTSSDNQIICQIERIRNVHRVDNHGNHPSFGKYYYWSPQHVKVLVGDVVRWDWDFPFYITTMKPKVEETYNMTTKYGKPGGFSSGSFGTSTGFYSHEFSEAGTFYYWSGNIDEYGTTWFHGSVEVVQRTSNLADVTVTLDGFEAMYNLTGTTTTLDVRTCSDTTASRVNCSDPLPVESTNATKFQFAFWTCGSPVVDKISRQNGTTIDEILISGNGFSGISCSNNVTFGDYICKVSSSSVSSVTCNIDTENNPRIGRPQYLDFMVNNMGYAHVKIDENILKTFALFPLVNQISPTNGSRGGQTRLTISGTGFDDGNLSNLNEVTVGGYLCDIVSSSYTEIVCLTPSSNSGQRAVSVIISTDGSLRIPAECDSSCHFMYDDSMTPTVTDISPTSITGENKTTFTIVGTGFGDEKRDVNVIMTSSEKHRCIVTDVSYSQIVCALTYLPVGANLVVVEISGKGRSLNQNGDISLASIATISTISPYEGSKYGRTDVTVSGNGFLSDVTVDIDGSPCTVKDRTVMSVVFTTVGHAIGIGVVTIRSNGVTYPVQTLNFTEDASPRILAVHPSSGTSGQNITITGYNLGAILNQTHVFVGENTCTITAVEQTEINCIVGNHRAGTYAIYVNVHDLGNSNNDTTFTFNMSANAIAPSSGSLAGGQTVTILGTGFDDDMEVTICGQTCNKSQWHKTESKQHVCEMPPLLGSSLMQCNVHVTVNNVTETLNDAYTYDPSLTPAIDEVTPKRGGTQGGTRITISGSNFGSTRDTTADCASSVTIAGTLCNITSWANERVVCVTEAHSKSERAVVRLETGCNGKADEVNAGFHFVDVWSSVYTWGGAALGLPTAGDIVVIQKGQTIVFDTDTPVLKMLVIQGGELVFDETDVELQAENILITDGGLLQVGTEDEPFQHKATITLHGHHRSKELPIYGTKSIAVREGTLDLHGAHVPITWTKLTQSTAVGDTQIQLQHGVTWQKGDQIIISTTGGVNSQSESEFVTIASVAVDNKTITLNSTLAHPHLGTSETEFDLSAEVGLLTRNLVVRGRSDPQWIEKINACPDGFDSGYFAIQTCVQGRYGEEMGSDQFGAQVIIHTTDPTKQLTTSRIEYVEFVHVGQAFRLGRHPINFHVTGDMSKSYVRGCGIYNTFNRAINIRDTHNLLVDRNVIYNVNGAAIFLEDGTETGNVFQYNLGVFVKGSSQLLNDDISPAMIWVTNPNNTLRHNVAAGGTHFGYLFHLENTVSSSLTGTHRPQLTPLAEFNNNTAHSLGWYGLWIYPKYIPRVMYSFNSYSSTRKVAVIDNMNVWNCRKGIFVEEMGAVQIRSLTAVDNTEAGYEGGIVVEGNQYTNDSPLLEDSIIAGYVSGIATHGCTNGGIVSPYKFGFTIRNVSFVNFDKPYCSALAITRIPERCASLCGGYMYRTENLTFINAANRVNNDWIWESVYEDMDGTLCGAASCKVVPCTGTLPSNCTTFSNSSHVPLCTCPADVKLVRFAIDYYSYASSSWPLLFTNQYGSTRHQYRSRAIDPSRGWMTNLVLGESYTWNFDSSRVLTNFSYNGYFYRMQYGDYVIINQALTGEPDEFRIDGYNLIPATNETLDPETHLHGDWQYNETSGLITYLVSYRRRGQTDDIGMQDILINLRIKKCFFKGCVTPPTLPPTTVQTTPSSTTACVYWSSPTSWPNNTLPVDGDDVTITKGICMIADTVIPRLDKLVIYGVLEFDHGPTNSTYRNFTLSATDIIIIGGNLLIGSPNSPFLGKLHIILRGRRPGHSDTEEYLPLTNIPVNSKTIAVYGGLELHGKDVGVSWTRLTTTGNPGDTAITLVDNVTWGVGEEIVIAPTSYDIWETETFMITDVSDDGLTLTLNDSLQFRHIAISFDGVVAHEEMITGRRVIMSATVGLLTRNIRVLSEDEDALYREGYGGRVVVGATVTGNVFHNGFARFSNVEFYHTGQYDSSSFTNKRVSLTYHNAGIVTEDKPSSVTKCVFHHGFSAAIGVHGTNGLTLTDNVIYHSVSFAIETQSLKTTIQRNLVVLVSGSSFYFGAISGMGSKELTLTDNTVSGTYGVAFHVPGVECGLTSGPAGNEVHSSSIGLAVFPGDNVQGSCYQISNYLIWKCNDIGMYYNNILSVVFIDNILAENTLGIYTQVIGPSAAAHLYSPKHCTVKDSIIIGATPSYNCTSDQAKYTAIGSQITGGHVGLTFASFMQGSNGAPLYDLIGIRTYPAIMGVTKVEGVTFAHFKTICGTKDVMLTTNKANDDGQHPVVTSGITKHESENDSYFFIHRPNIEKINPSDCVDMDCDGMKKALIKDEDGSFLGANGAVLSVSEWEWDGDPRRGLGDYRIPREMLTTLTGERINVSSIAPHKGIIRNDQCLYRSSWQAYECHDLTHQMLIIESLDADTETRRLSPVAILGDGYLDLINGPQDHSSCSQGNCRKRLSTFMAIVASGKPYVLHFTTTSPQTLRLSLLNSDDTQVVTLGIWYSQSNRRDVYVNDELVLAKNARMVNGKYLVDPPSWPGEFVPDVNSTDVTGTNFFDRDSNILYVLVRDSSPVKIVTNPSFIVSFQIPALTPEEFYGEALIHNLALFFDVPPEKIRVVNVVRESGRRRRDVAEDIEIQVEIGDPPIATGNATVNETLTRDALLNMSSKFTNEVQGGGNISKVVNMTVRGVAITETPREVREDGKNTMQDSSGKLTVAKSLRISVQPASPHENTPFATQPCMQLFDTEDDPMTIVGGSSNHWQMTAYLISGTNQSAQLQGTTTVNIVGGWANFTDLGVSYYGDNYSIEFNKTYPKKGNRLNAKTDVFAVKKLDVSLRSNVSNDRIITNNVTEMRIQLINNNTKQKISSINWMGHTWTAAVGLSSILEPPGNMTGSREVIFDSSTGEAVFDNLVFDQIGIYILSFHITSSPEEYTIHENVPVQVLNQQQLDLLGNNTATNISMTFDADFQEVVGDKDDEFGAKFVNILTLQHPDALFDSVTVKEGCIEVETNLRTKPGDMNTTIDGLIETLKNTSFTFNGTTVSNPIARFNEESHMDDTTTDQVPTTATTMSTTESSSVTTIETTSSTLSSAKVTTTTPSTLSSAKVTTTTPSTLSSAKVTTTTPSTISSAKVTTTTSSTLSSAKVTTTTPSTLSSAKVTTTTSSTLSSAKVTTTTPSTLSSAKVTTMITPSTLSSAKVTTTTPSTLSSAELSVPVVIAIVITTLALLLGVIMAVIFFKCNRMRRHEITEHLTTTSTVSSDDFIPRKYEMESNAYCYLRPDDINDDMKPHQRQIPRLSTTLRPFTPK